MTNSSNRPVSRKQTDLESAHNRIKAVKQLVDRDDTARKRFNSLCLSFPALVMRDGLCQTVAFYEAKEKRDKRTGARLPSEPHALMLTHIAEISGIEADRDLAVKLARLDLGDYLHVSNRLLEAWVFEKRMAESLLDAVAGDEGADQ